MAHSSSLCSSVCLLSIFVLLSLPPGCILEPQIWANNAAAYSTSEEQVLNKSAERCNNTVVCRPGVLLPTWEPLNPPLGENAGRAIVYFACLAYMFLGVSIIADRFMSSIEVITAQEKEITVTMPDGEVSVTTVRIWNETVSNLTLMALGSSAPEILLSVIEVCGHGFKAGELGPGTIVGSAAFNMFVIIAICVWVIPKDETRRIKHLRVYFFTAAWSIFAYIWLFLILSVISPGVVEVWEALVTLLCFPVGVVLAWVIDRRLIVCVPRRYRYDSRTGVIIGMEGVSPGEGPRYITDAEGNIISLEELEKSREEAIRILKELKEKHPEKSLEELWEMANYNLLLNQPKSRAFYRIQALRMLIGSGNVLKKHVLDLGPLLEPEEALVEPEDIATCSYISFETDEAKCLENCGSISLPVVCRGGTGQNTFYVNYSTEEGTAQPVSDYEHCEGTLVFKPGEIRKEIEVVIIDDDIFEEEEHFLVRLHNLRIGDASGVAVQIEEDHAPLGRLVEPTVCRVTILDDDHAGIFTFNEETMEVKEGIGTLEVTVLRNTGSRGTVRVPYHTEAGTARGEGLDFEDVQGELMFLNNQTSQTIQIPITDHHEYKRQDNFFIFIEEPIWIREPIQETPDTLNLTAAELEARRIADMGRPILGQYSKLEVIIKESSDFKSTVDELLKANTAQVLSTHSWRDQFVEAFTVSAGDEDDDADVTEERKPSVSDYIMHILSLFWKIVFAFIPPTDYLNGWACFIVSIFGIGILTAVIGDLASHFGCTVGLKDSVTAVVFVALGTSLPDTFASKVAATQDEYADASVGNVTGSNAVNVFLGLGVAWSLASIYWAAQGTSFNVDPGSLAFFVTLFVIFAVICMVALFVRRQPAIGGELGGPRMGRIITVVLFLGVWMLYILFASLEAYCHIEGF